MLKAKAKGKSRPTNRSPTSACRKSKEPSQGRGDGARKAPRRSSAQHQPSTASGPALTLSPALALVASPARPRPSYSSDVIEISSGNEVGSDSWPLGTPDGTPSPMPDLSWLEPEWYRCKRAHERKRKQTRELEREIERKWEQLREARRQLREPKHELELAHERERAHSLMPLPNWVHRTFRRDARHQHLPHTMSLPEVPHDRSPRIMETPHPSLHLPHRMTVLAHQGPLLPPTPTSR